MSVPHDDRGLLLGDGLFETLLARDGALVLAEAHLSRLARGCEALGLPAPDLGEALALCEAAARSSGAPRAAVRLTLTAGSGGRGLERPASPALRMFATAAPAVRPEGPAHVLFAEVRRNARSPASRVKSLAYLDNVLARRQATAAGVDEAVMLNGAGEIACASAANLFWLKGGRLFTPALACGVLDGIMRGAVIAAASNAGVGVEEGAWAAEAMLAADAVYLSNSLIGVRRVAEIAGRPIPGQATPGWLDDVTPAFA